MLDAYCHSFIVCVIVLVIFKFFAQLEVAICKDLVIILQFKLHLSTCLLQIKNFSILLMFLFIFLFNLTLILNKWIFPFLLYQIIIFIWWTKLKLLLNIKCRLFVTRLNCWGFYFETSTRFLQRLFAEGHVHVFWGRFLFEGFIDI